MRTVLKREKETRKDYLVRVAVLMLSDNADFIEPIKYDGAECDASCLSDDLESEFDIKINEQ